MKSTYLYKIVKPHEQLIKFALSVVVHWPVDVFPLACGRASTGQWTTTEGANLINASTAL